MNRSFKSILTCLAILTATFILTALNAPDAHAALQARWTPVDHRAEEAYWAQRNGNLTMATLEQARAQADTLPSASALPAIGRRGAATASAGNSPESSYRWLLTGPSPENAGGTYYSGRISALAVDPTTSGATTVIYLGAANGGVWKSSNNGATWKPLLDKQDVMAIGSIAIDPNNHNILYVAMGEPNSSLDSYFSGGGLILKSTNGGTTWSKRYMSSGSGYTASWMYRIIVNPRNSAQLFLATSVGLFISNDAGATWGVVSNAGANSTGWAGQNARIYALDIDVSANPVHLYATVSGYGVYRSFDGGTTWNPVNSGLPSGSAFTNRSVLAIAPSNPLIVYMVLVNGGGAMYQSGSYNGGYYTTNGGTSWSPLNLTVNLSNTQGWYDLYVAVDPLNANIAYIGGIDIGVAATATTGGAFTNITSVYGFDNSNIHPDQHALAFAPGCAASPCPFYAGNDGGIFYTSNPLAGSTSVTYTNLNTAGLAITEFTGGDSGPNYASNHLLLGGTQDNGTLKYTGNAIWSETLGSDGGFSAIDPGNTQNMYTETQNGGFYKSTNGGTSWFYAGSGLSGGLFYTPFQLDRLHTNHLVFGGSRVYETLDSAGAWYPSSQFFSSNVSAVTTDPSNSAVIYAGLTNGKVYKTTTGYSGTSSTYVESDTNIPAGSYINQIVVDSTNASMVYLVTGAHWNNPTGKVYKSIDGGSTWTSISGNLPTIPINSIVTYYSGATRVLVVGTDVGVYFSTNEGTSWVQLNAGLPNTTVSQIVLDQAHSTLIAFTHGRSAWALPIAGAPSTGPDTIGIYRAGTFYLRNANTTGFANIMIPYTVGSQPYPIVGDWTGAGFDSIGVYDRATGNFFLRNTNTPGPADEIIRLGNANDLPISGRWSATDTHDGIGVFRPTNGLIYIRSTLTTGFADFTMTLGIPGDRPVAGDWNGDGVDSPGVFRPQGFTFYLSDKITNGAVIGDYQLQLGNGGDQPISGDWVAQGHDGVGVFRPTNGFIYLKNALSPGFADTNIVYGTANDVAVAGHWVVTGSAPPPMGVIVVPQTPTNPIVPTPLPTQAPPGGSFDG